MDYKLIQPVNESYTVLEQILTNRGIKREDIKHYLNVNEKDDLPPRLLDNIERAAVMLLSHISNGDKIEVCVDSDCDGYTSAALLLNYIYARFPSAIGNFHYYTHDGKTHGLHDLAIDGDVKLIIAPDSSSNDYDIHEALAKNGIDVLVLDHHQADKISEYACVVNNQLCDYPTKSLSGVGVVYKLCEFIDEQCGDPLAASFLDIVALGLDETLGEYIFSKETTLGQFN